MDGMLPVEVTLHSNAVETEGGLTTLMQSSLTPGLSAPPEQSTAARMKPLMLMKKLLAWSDATVVTDEDKKEVYEVYINGTKAEMPAETYVGTMDTLFGPIYELLTAAKNAGASGFEMSYSTDGLAELVVTKDGHTYQYLENRNQVLIDNTEYNECVDMPVMRDGVMIANVELMLGYAGVSFSKDKANKRLNITIQ